MALSVFNLWILSSSLMVLSCLHPTKGTSGWAGCLSGEDVFASVKENSARGEVVAEVPFDMTMEGIHWSLAGKDASWFYLNGREICLNISADQGLDRESLGPILTAELSCNEEGLLQSVYRLIVEILNENDHLPEFESTEQNVSISELTETNTVIFTVRAVDADNDKIIYTIDPTSPDAEYFKVDLPNSGEVILSKPLDFETKRFLMVVVCASEMNTVERYNTSINVTITVLDGDDQYPQFVPCVLLFQDERSHICTSPVYTVNVTEGEEDIVLDFSPGPIQAEDGDRGINSPISYAILPGEDKDRFHMDGKTGVVRLIQGVKDRLTRPLLRLQVMAYQDDDPMKYTVATVLVRTLAVNHFHPEFSKGEYRGFVIAGKSPVSLVNTYGSKALMLHVHDQDFTLGLNPMIYFSFWPASNYTNIYQVTQSGLLIAEARRLQPKQKHVLEVMAVDQETGEAARVSVVVEVLSEGQSIPHGPLGDDRMIGCTVGKALFLSTMFMSLLGCVVLMSIWLKKKHKGMRGPLERGCVAQCKHPNVSLRWFQLVSHGNAMPQMEEVHFKNEEYGTCNPSFSFSDKPNSPPKHQLTPTIATSFDITVTPTQTVCAAANLNNSAATSTITRSPTFIITKEERSPTYEDQDTPPAEENLHSHDGTPGEAGAESNTSQSVRTFEDTSTLTDPDVEVCTNNNLCEEVKPPHPPSSPSCSLNMTVPEEIDPPILKTCVTTASDEEFVLLPLPEDTASTPPTPEHPLLKATLIHINASPTSTPPETPGVEVVIHNVEEDQPCTSLDQIEPVESADVGDGEENQERRLSADTVDEQSVPTSRDDEKGHEDAEQGRDSDGTKTVQADDRRWSI